MSKIMILNTKGGVTKSTTAVQIIAPFLYWKSGENEKVNLFEFDDENEDSITFINSKILNSKRIKISGNDLDINLINTILENDNLVIDVGGNKTTTYMINALENTNLINGLDCIVIPLTDGEQDSINAIKVYKKIRDLSNDIKVVFVLGRADKSMDIEIDFGDFFGDTKGLLDGKVGYIEDINDNDRNIIKVYKDESVKASRRFGTTVFELSKQDMSILKDKMKQYLKDKDNDKVKKVAYRITLINKSIRFKDEVLKECFKVLNEVIA